MKYGKTPYGKRRAKGVQPEKRQESFQARFTGKADLEQFSAAFQTLIAALQESGVQAIENCAVYFAPLDISGKQIMLRDKDGSVLKTFKIDIPSAAPASTPAGVRHLVSPAVLGSGIDERPARKNVLAFNSRA